MIKFNEQIVFGKLIKRYKRFFMDVELDDGSIVTAHTPNTGSMMGLLKKDSPVMLTKHNDPKRKTKYSAQAIYIDNVAVGINTHLPNRLIKNNMHTPELSDFHTYQSIKSEVKYGQDNRSRIDLLCSNAKNNAPNLYIEIKNVTLKVGSQAQFPDAVSIRAQKHILDLLYMKELGFNAALIFVVQRTDCKEFCAAHHIDKEYGKLLLKAKNAGVIIKALSAKISKKGLKIENVLPLVFPA